MPDVVVVLVVLVGVREWWCRGGLPVVVVRVGRVVVGCPTDRPAPPALTDRTVPGAPADRPFPVAGMGEVKTGIPAPIVTSGISGRVAPTKAGVTSATRSNRTSTPV